jgi:hypothetical protein
MRTFLLLIVGIYGIRNYEDQEKMKMECPITDMSEGEMNKTVCALIVLFMGISTLVFAKTEKTINERNEYGGKMLMVTYLPGDKEYTNGFTKIITYFDSNGKIVKESRYDSRGCLSSASLISNQVGCWEFLALPLCFSVLFLTCLPCSLFQPRV